MPVFTRSTVIPASPEKLFKFHENPHNLRRISAPGLRIMEIRAEHAARPGEEFRLVLRQGPITLRWTGRWETVEAPCLLVDTGVHCPFAYWRHSHIFEPRNEGSIMTDRVEYRSPWWQGGPLADWIAGRLVFPRMFAARHTATRHFFSART
jgi:ligand-binding SRPBCC domain-containing protein